MGGVFGRERMRSGRVRGGRGRGRGRNGGRKVGAWGRRRREALRVGCEDVGGCLGLGGAVVSL